MKRKLVLGLGGAVLAGILGLAAFFYFTVFQPARSVMGDLDQMARLKSMNDGVWNRDAYIAPPDGHLTADQIGRFARIQSAMRIGLGSTYSFLDERAARLKGLARTGEDGPRAGRLGIRDAILALRGLGPVLIRAKESQVNALNAEGFSVEEYRWVRRGVYGALGFSRDGVYLEDFPAGPETTSPRIPTDRDRELAAAYADSVETWFPFLVFGL
jgi:hypothetical protein